MIRIVTDSSADLPATLVAALGITVVPMTVNFGAESLLDGVEIDHDRFYHRLAEGTVFPSTTQPTAAQFASAYAGLPDADAILSIHPAEEMSGTINSARQAARAGGAGRRIEILDSRTTSMGMGFAVLDAARQAAAGAPFDAVLQSARSAVARSHLGFAVETLEFLARGGRIGQAKRLLGTLLRIKPVLTIREGRVEPLAQPRTRAHVLDRLRQFAEEHQPLAALSVGYSTDRGEAEAFADRLAELTPRGSIVITQLGPAIGTHVGPGCLSVALLTRS